MMGYNYFSSLFYNRHANEDRRQGSGFGLNEAFLGLGAAGGSLLGGLAVDDWGARAPFGMAAAVILVALSWQVVRFSRFRQRLPRIPDTGPGSE
jgi:predicted MFS family arabinose efflux permease